MYGNRHHYISMLSLDIDDEYQDLIGVTPLEKTSGEKSGWNREEVIYDHLELIPLSEEWLVKLGFKESRSHFEKGFPLWVCIGGLTGPTDIWIHGNYTPAVKVGYVHQLQNLHFALTGEELTIKE